MFDRGIVSLEDDGRIIMAEKLVPEPVRRMMNPDRYALLPAQFLRYHCDKVSKG
jgi:hypothetical protein